MRSYTMVAVPLNREEEREEDMRLESRAHTSAWIVNWICVALIFCGLIMLGNTLRDVSGEQVRTLKTLQVEGVRRDAEIEALRRTLEVSSPKDVLPHVLKIEQMMASECPLRAAR
jgi:hypothetical protein